MKDTTSVWCQVQARNKKSVALDLRQAAAQDIVRCRADESDVLVENFRSGALESLGLDPALLMQRKPRRIGLRISGYGQTGPYRDKPGFGVLREPAGSALPGIVPKLSRTPGRHRRRAPELGQDTEDMLKSLQPASPTPRP